MKSHHAGLHWYGTPEVWPRVHVTAFFPGGRAAASQPATIYRELARADNGASPNCSGVTRVRLSMGFCDDNDAGSSPD